MANSGLHMSLRTALSKRRISCHRSVSVNRHWA